MYFLPFLIPPNDLQRIDAQTITNAECNTKGLKAQADNLCVKYQHPGQGFCYVSRNVIVLEQLLKFLIFIVLTVQSIVAG